MIISNVLINCKNFFQMKSLCNLWYYVFCFPVYIFPPFFRLILRSLCPHVEITMIPLCLIQYMSTWTNYLLLIATWPLLGCRIGEPGSRVECPARPRLPAPGPVVIKKDDEPLLNLTGAIWAAAQERRCLCVYTKEGTRVPSLNTGVYWFSGYLKNGG